MNLTKGLKDKNVSETSSSISKAFDQCISILLEEIRLAIQWNRPSILLAVHTSKHGREKAKKTLQHKLSSLSTGVVQISPNSEQSDLFGFIKQADKPDQYVYFLEGIGGDSENYRAVNLYREKVVEKKLILLFWLTEKEAKELPRLAPDFWAFRHRVVEFAPSRGSRRNVLPTGMMMWQDEIPSLMYESLGEKISFQEELLHQLPSTEEALALRAEATYLLARYYWLKGETQTATGLLQRELNHIDRLQIADLAATFLNGLAIISYEFGNYEEALEMLERATILNPHYQVLWANLGMLQHVLGKTVQALQTIKKVIKLVPHSSWFWYILGYLHLSSGKPDMAMPSFEESRRLNVDNVFASYAIIACHTRVENLDEQKKGLQLLSSSLKVSSTYHSICTHALSGNKAAALDTLRLALKSGMISPAFLRRDPTLHIIFDETTLKPLI